MFGTFRKGESALTKFQLLPSQINVAVKPRRWFQNLFIMLILDKEMLGKLTTVTIRTLPNYSLRGAKHKPPFVQAVVM